MPSEKFCEERHDACKIRMDEHKIDIDKIFTTKASRGLLILFFIVLLGSYTYTYAVSEKVSGYVTKADMTESQDKILDAIKGIK